jgi:hypothetical protein
MLGRICNMWDVSHYKTQNRRPFLRSESNTTHQSVSNFWSWLCEKNRAGWIWWYPLISAWQAVQCLESSRKNDSFYPSIPIVMTSHSTLQKLSIAFSYSLFGESHHLLYYFLWKLTSYNIFHCLVRALAK